MGFYHNCYIAQLQQCNKRLLKIEVADCISRVPRVWRSIPTGKVHVCNRVHRVASQFIFYSGAELRNWLLFYSLPVLHGMLPNEYLHHLALLVGAIFIFSTQEILPSDFHLGKTLLEQFYKDFSILYD